MEDYRPVCFVSATATLALVASGFLVPAVIVWGVGLGCAIKDFKDRTE